MARRVRAYIGLGSNVGRSRATLAGAVGALAALPGVRVRGVSRLYRTRPVGVVDQPDFVNAAVALDIPAGGDQEADGLGLLGQLKSIEAAFGRTAGPRWGPRSLDLDLLLLGRAQLAVERPPEFPGRAAPAPRLLQVPHRDVAERLFVLAPLSDLAPGLVPPGWHETIRTARRRVARLEGAAAARAIGAWDPFEGRWRAPAARPAASSRPREARSQTTTIA